MFRAPGDAVCVGVSGAAFGAGAANPALAVTIGFCSADRIIRYSHTEKNTRVAATASTGIGRNSFRQNGTAASFTAAGSSVSAASRARNTFAAQRAICQMRQTLRAFVLWQRAFEESVERVRVGMQSGM